MGWVFLGAALVCLAIEIILPGWVVGTLGVALYILAMVELAAALPLWGVVLVGAGGLILEGFVFFAALRRIRRQPGLSLPGNLEAGADSLPGDLKGKLARTLTELRPSGYVAIGSDRYQAVAESGFLNPDANVLIVEVRASYVIVREYKEDVPHV